MKFTIKTNINKVIKDLNDIARKQVPFAVSKALNETAKEIKRFQVQEMQKVFDRPTPYTLNSIFIKNSTKRDLSVEVSFKDKLGHIHVAPQVYGGERKFKRSEKWLQRIGAPSGSYWVPGKGARLNQYGNISGGNITQILSALGANPDPYSNTTVRSRKRNKKIPTFVLIKPGFQLAPGVWQRYGVKNRKLKPILMFTNRPQYKERYRFFDIAINTIQKHFDQKFREALDYALNTAK